MTLARSNFDQLMANIRTRLPIQNPLHSFVHNNILLMFEGKDFHEALDEAGALYRARTYWPLEKYMERYSDGKITDDDISQACDHYLGRYTNFPVLKKFGITDKEFCTRLMFSDLAFNNDEVQPKINDNHLWDMCLEKTQGQELILSRSPTKWRAKEYWERYHRENYAISFQPLVIRLISSYLDQGQSFWSNPFVNKGFWSFFCFDALAIQNVSTPWQKILATKINDYENSLPELVIQAELQKMEIPEEKWESFILEVLFDLKGWSGMVNKLELEPWQAMVKAPEIKLVDYIAAMILIESSIDSYHASEHSIDLSLIYGRKENITMRSFQLSLALYQFTKFFKLDSKWLQDLTPQELTEVVDQMDMLENTHKIRLWHEAYEHHFYREALSAIIQHHDVPVKSEKPYAQALFCIDDREESIRRHIEEVDPRIMTFGVVGFFGIDMKFASVKNQRLIAQCPPVINPSRIVREISKDQKKGLVFDRVNNLLGHSGLSFYYHTRTLFRGFFSTLILGALSLIPMFLQVFFPHQSKTFKKSLKNLLSPEPITEINIEKGEGDHGYSKEEMSKIVHAILNMCGLSAPFAPLIAMIGHGSTSTNNPFRQAYGCGACGGNAGVPNSRAFAKMANDPIVRSEVAKLGISIPAETIFVSGFHDTTIDEVNFFDFESLPSTHQEAFDLMRKSMNKACKLNAFERCQRFSSTEAKSSPEEALKHVRERAEDLAQPRPEYGHCTTALSVLGRRNLTKNLFLNRRAFLISYDWEIDPEGTILFQTVIGAIPVCVNINMDYYFSCVDNDNFGSGSKLPLNLTSLMGVMTGSQSDLRIGLARQMVEIHEPIRNMTIIEAPLERVKNIFDSHPRLRNILYHHWTRMVVYDPQSLQWFIYGQNEWRPFEADRYTVKHFNSSMDLINATHTQEDFAEIDHD